MTGRTTEETTGAARRAELEARGWRRMNVYDEPRLSELAEAYRDIGYEVHLEPVRPDEALECAECVTDAPDRFRTIYIRDLDAG